MRVRNVSQLRNRLSPDQFAELEAYLLLTGALIPSERPPPTRQHNLDDDDDDLSDDEAFPRSSAAKVNGHAEKNIRGPARREEDDDDSDFDL